MSYDPHMDTRTTLHRNPTEDLHMAFKAADFTFCGTAKDAFGFNTTNPFRGWEGTLCDACGDFLSELT